MFNSVRLPHKLDKAEFAEISERLREKLLEAQFEFLERKQKSLLLLINGSDGAGKGEVLNRLYEWLDDHSLETLSYGAPTEEERLRPLEWRYGATCRQGPHRPRARRLAPSPAASIARRARSAAPPSRAASTRSTAGRKCFARRGS